MAIPTSMLTITDKNVSTQNFNDFISENHHFKAVKDHLYSDLNGEAVVLSLKNGKYYGLNGVGASIWKTMQTPITFKEIKTAVMQEYEVDDATCDKEVLSFLVKMTEEQLVEILNETTA